MKKILLSAAFMLLVFPAVFNTSEMSAQTVSVKVGTENEEKKEVIKEKVVEKEVVKSGPSLEQELKKVFGMKSETSIGGARIENLGKYFLGIFKEFLDRVRVGRVEGKSYHRFHLGKIDFDHGIGVCHALRLELLIFLGSAVNFVVLFDYIVGFPNRRQTGGFGSHNVNAVSKVHRKRFDAVANEF